MARIVIFTAKAERDLEKFPDDTAKRIILKIEDIAQGDDPYQKLDKMTDSPYYKMILHLVKARHRSNVYKK